MARKKTSAKKTSSKTPPRKSSKSARKTAKKPAGSGKRASPTAKSPKKSAAKKAAGKSPPKRSRKAAYATAESMAKAQRSISVSEFFAKNRHLLGFDNPRKALLTTVKEAVDNSLDACEEAGILPELVVEITQVEDNRYRVAVEDNGPGIVKNQIPNIFGKLLYGSKFHRLKMSRGQQGIGISAAGMYGLLTTGQPVRITSRTSRRSEAHYYELQIDTKKNRPDIITDRITEWDVAHGTRVEIELTAKYLRGRQSVDEYLAQTAITNPHVNITYHAPDGREEAYPCAVKDLPATPREIRPHPHGVELGVLIKMMQDTKAKTLQQFLTGEFSRVSPRVAGMIVDAAGLKPRNRPSRLNGSGAQAIYNAIQETKILSPATDCVVPIGEDKLISGLKQVVDAGFHAACTRKPAVYRGNPFIIEAAIAYGRPENPESGARTPGRGPAGKKGEDDGESAQLARVLRFANRVPLQYQQGACAVTKCVADLNWKSYGLAQGKGALPTGPLTIVVHMASVWVPFTSESKEAIASYPEILKEIRLALQECGRKLGRHIRRNIRARQEMKKRSYIQKYIPAIGEALRDILDLKDKQVESACEELRDVLERSRKM